MFLRLTGVDSQVWVLPSRGPRARRALTVLVEAGGPNVIVKVRTGNGLNEVALPAGVGLVLDRYPLPPEVGQVEFVLSGAGSASLLGTVDYLPGETEDRHTILREL